MTEVMNNNCMQKMPLEKFFITENKNESQNCLKICEGD